MNISVVIITKDEEDNIARCIESVSRISDDVIVVDSGSYDATADIAKAKGASVFHYDWQGYGANKNYGIAHAKYDWILSLDADEALSDELENSIMNVSLEMSHLYLVNVLTSYCGQWIRYCGWHPLWRPRLFNKQDHEWNTDIIHEQLTGRATKQAVKLSGKLLHYSYPTRKVYKNKVDHYATLKAQSWIDKSKTPSVFKKALGPTFRFFRTYILKLGILDGKAGWEISKMNCYMIRRTLQIYSELSKN